MHIQDKEKSEHGPTPMNRRMMLKRALGAGLAGLPLLYGLQWLFNDRDK